MKQYQTTSIISLYSGRVGMSEAQALRRTGVVKIVGKGVYEILSPLRFKAGEVIYLDKPAKVTIKNLVCLDDPEPVQKAKPGPKPKKAIK